MYVRIIWRDDMFQFLILFAISSKPTWQSVFHQAFMEGVEPPVDKFRMGFPESYSFPVSLKFKDSSLHLWLVGGLEHEFYFSIQLGIIIPTDSYFSEG